MNKRNWILLALLVILGLLLIVPPVPRPKARAQRIHGVNNISSFSATSSAPITMPSTNVQPAATSK
ncbi:MAG: hypothetical protein ACLQU3_23055 [Limisphaerales bacterium]